MGVLEETQGRIENERGEWGMGLEPLTGRARDDTWAFGLLTGPQVWARIEYSYLLRLASIEKLWMLLHSFFFACDTIQR